MSGLVVAALALAIWLYLLAGRGLFWRTAVQLPPLASPVSHGDLPRVVAVVPARDEADVLPRTLPTLLAQDYGGAFDVVVVDDASSDGTGDIARSLGARVIRTSGPPSGWVGKVAAMSAGVAAADDAQYLLFTDADISYPPDALTALVEAATSHDLDLISQMVRLRTVGFWERLIVPAFVYFFAQLYPFSLVNRQRSRVAAAAGGCMLVKADALNHAGGLAKIADALIDDVSLARLISNSSRRRIWLGLSARIESVREYPRLADLWRMVSRSAYTQLSYSPRLLVGTVIGSLLVYAVPPAATIAGAVSGSGSGAVFSVGLAAWLVMTATYLPMLRFYRLGSWRAPLLPVVALLYAAMTIDSAWQHRRGRGGAWKGRTR